MKRSVTVTIGEFASELLAGERAPDREHVRARLVEALRLYLRDRGRRRPGWAFPSFLPRGGEKTVRLKLDVDEELWRAIAEEAARQGVSVSLMARHAALYCVAELDAGNITQRILNQLGEGEAAPRRH